MTTEQQLGERAIVIGAGMGGLMAAGVLARYFAEVLVLDKDRLPTLAEPRTGVPQGAQGNALLVGGRRNVEKIFPGFTSDIIDGGAIVARNGLELHIHDWLGWWPKRDIGLPGIFMTRPLLESTVRSLLARNGRVTIRDGVTVSGWKHAGKEIEVTVSGGQGETLKVDFVIDATGRAGQAKEMLEANGYGPVEEIIIGIGETHTTAMFEIPAGLTDASHSFIVQGAPPVSHSAGLFAVEGGRWTCSLTGRFDEAPPRDLQGFMAFAKNLSDPCIYDRISKAKQLTPAVTYRAMHSKWRRYEKMAEFPDRLLPLGDAIAQVNPIFGQGMALASHHAMSLWQALEARANSGASLDGVAKDYLAETVAFTQQVWSGLEVVDFAFPKTTGERPADIEQRQAFINALRRLGQEDPEVHRLIMRCAQLVDPTSVLGAREDITVRVQAIMAKG